MFDVSFVVLDKLLFFCPGFPLENNLKFKKISLNPRHALAEFQRSFSRHKRKKLLKATAVSLLFVRARERHRVVLRCP